MPSNSVKVFIYLNYRIYQASLWSRLELGIQFLFPGLRIHVRAEYFDKWLNDEVVIHQFSQIGFSDRPN